MTRRNASPDKTVGFGWVGRWYGGDIGWNLPNHLTGHREETAAPHSRVVLLDDRFVKCRITIEVVKDSLGRPITRRASTIGACKKD